MKLFPWLRLRPTRRHLWKPAGDLRVDEKAGKIFCLVQAPDPDSAHTVHREAHGLVAGEIYEVSEGV